MPLSHCYRELQVDYMEGRLYVLYDSSLCWSNEHQIPIINTNILI